MSLAQRLEALALLARTAELPPDAARILSEATTRSTVLRPLRDRVLIEAAHLLRDPGDGARWRWPAAERVVETIRLVEVRRGPRWDRNGVPPDADPVEVLIYNALRLGVAFPADPRSVWNLLE